jgi:hypothetical protein
VPAELTHEAELRTCAGQVTKEFLTTCYGFRTTSVSDPDQIQAVLYDLLDRGVIEIGPNLK